MFSNATAGEGSIGHIPGFFLSNVSKCFEKILGSCDGHTMYGGEILVTHPDSQDDTYRFLYVANRRLKTFGHFTETSQAMLA